MAGRRDAVRQCGRGTRGRRSLVRSRCVDADPGALVDFRRAAEGVRGAVRGLLVTTRDEVQGEVRAWLDETWDPERPLWEWRSLLADSGWGCPTWPVEYYGRGLPFDMAGVVTKEFAGAGAVGPAG